MRPLKLLFVSPYYPPYTVGGAEESTFELAQALTRRGHDVSVLAVKLGPEPPSTTIPVQTVDIGRALTEPGKPLRPGSFERIRVQRRIARAVTGASPGVDLVHCQTLHLLPGAYFGARRAGVPIVATIRDLGGVCPLNVCLLAQARVPHDCGVRKLQTTCVPQFRDVYGTSSRVRLSASSLLYYATARGRSALLRRCDAVYSVGADLGELYRAAGLLDENVQRLPNIVQHDSSPPAPPGAPYALYAGKVSPGKGCGFLLEAVAKVRAALPEFRLIVAGYPQEGWQARLERAAGVEWVGRVSRAQVRELYRGARFAVVPSIWPEPLPRAALEAASAELAVVGTRVGGIPEVVVDGETGILVAPRDAAALADAVRQLWLDPQLAERMGAAGKRLVELRFSAAAVCEQAERLYFAAIAGGDQGSIRTATTRKAVARSG